MDLNRTDGVGEPFTEMRCRTDTSRANRQLSTWIYILYKDTAFYGKI